ncbi:hypothetical protein [Streptomyces sp. NPDC002402]
MTEPPAHDRGIRSRDAILDTATELMSLHGNAATSISMISAACNLPASPIRASRPQPVATWDTART